jgi:DNA polymerase-3 subunit delta
MITTITGSNDFLRTQQLGNMINKFIELHGDIGIERLDGSVADADRLRGAVDGLPFLTERKLVILYEPSQQKKFYEHIEDILSGVDDSVDVVIVEPKLDKRGSYFKLLKKLTTFMELNELAGGDLAKWAVDYAKSQQGKLSFSDANILIARVGANQQLMKNEIDKLVLYRVEISRETIELLTEETPQSSIFELVDAAMSGDLHLVDRLYKEQRALKVEPQQIIAMLAWQLHVLALVKTAGDKTPEDIAKDAGLSPFVVKKSIGLVRGLSFDQIKTMIADALKLDTRLKSESLDSDEALQYYLLTLRS